MLKLPNYLTSGAYPADVHAVFCENYVEGKCQVVLITTTVTERLEAETVLEPFSTTHDVLPTF